MASSITHVLFDFFGTLVSYSASRTEQGYRRSYALLLAAEARVDYGEFLRLWDSTFESFEKEAERSLDEYSMDAVCREFLSGLLGRAPSSAEVSSFSDTYLEEWNRCVIDIAGVRGLIAELSGRFTLALVTNTHRAELIHRHLARMGLAEYFAAVVTSVEHGRRKPSPCIFNRTLALTNGKAEASVYVGDSLAADYQGARRAGLRGLLIDPQRRHDVPARDRLRHILDVRGRLAS